MKNAAKFTLLGGFTSQLLACTLLIYTPSCFYFILTAVAFCLFTLTIYLMSRGKWSLVAFVIFLSSFNALLDELFFNPNIVELNEYIGFLTTILLTLIYRKKWIR